MKSTIPQSERVKRGQAHLQVRTTVQVIEALDKILVATGEGKGEAVGRILLAELKRLRRAGRVI